MSENTSKKSQKTKMIAFLLALLVGGFGIHHFYLGNTGLGVIYLLFSWTGIPGIIGFVEAILFAVMSDEEFDRRYN